MTPREAAVRALVGVLREGSTLDETLPRFRDRLAAPRDRAFAQELCFGVLRWYFRLDFLSGRLLERPLRNRDMDVQAVILSGLYEMSHMRTPDHAAVSQSVETVKAIGRPRSAALVNAVLRRFQREQESLSQLVDAEPAARYAHPVWLLDALRSDWPEHWERIVEAGNERPALHLRVNRLRSSVGDFLTVLADAGLAAEPLPGTESGIRLSDPIDPEQLPGFADGIFSVQDAGAQLAAPLLDAEPGQRVLDACAAPGGKTCHILEREPGLAGLTAVDRDESRLGRLTKNLARLGLNARIACADSTIPGWHDGPPFDRILLDVPCSATGVIRRHPDIKLLRRPEHVSECTAVQDALLAANWPLLVRGGRMLYATCSLLREENDLRIEKFRNNNKDVRIVEIGGTVGIATGTGRQVVPGYADTDGFYYALLEKS